MPLAATSGNQPQQSSREAEAERPQEFQPQQTGPSSSSQESQGAATAEDIIHIDLGDGGAVADADAAASMLQESRKEYVRWPVTLLPVVRESMMLVKKMSSN